MLGACIALSYHCLNEQLNIHEPYVTMMPSVKFKQMFEFFMLYAVTAPANKQHFLFMPQLDNQRLYQKSIFNYALPTLINISI